MKKDSPFELDRASVCTGGKGYYHMTGQLIYKLTVGGDFLGALCNYSQPSLHNTPIMLPPLFPCIQMHYR